MRSQTRHHEAHVVLDEQHGDAPLVGEPAHEVRQLGGLDVAEAGGGLVEQQHDRLGRDGPGDGQQAPLTVRQVLGRCRSRSSREPELLGWPRPRRRAARDATGTDEVPEVGEPVAGVAGGAEVVEDGQVLEQLERLERPADPGPRPLAWSTMPQQVGGRRAATGPDALGEAGDGVDHRGLAGAVRPDQADAPRRAATVKLTLSTATTPPNRTVRSRTSSTFGATRTPAAAPPASPRRGPAVGPPAAASIRSTPAG